jgi:Animal haem peroxidase
MPPSGQGQHGKARGADHASRSPQFEGRYGRMFRRLGPAAFSDAALLALARRMVAEAETEPVPETQVDSEENQGIAAGYTYLGQFIDHDLTFDPASSLMQQNDPDALVDFRTPAFDLDSLYGRGPSDQPYLYEGNRRRFQLGRLLTGNLADPNARDVPRHLSETDGSRHALLGDPRNDGNVIVSELHATMLRFHNKIADENAGLSFVEVQQLVRFHYQWVVLHDFLVTIVGADTVESILPHLKSGKSILVDPPRLRFYKARNEPYIPVEFSAAAFRFGHSMVRPIYRLNTSLVRNPPPAPEDHDNVNGRQFVFNTNMFLSLEGFRLFPANWAIEWNLFFDMGDSLPNVGVKRLQRAHKIDTSIVNALGMLPASFGFDEQERSLPFRNLHRGVSLGLPSGQDVARAMGERVIRDDQLKVGPATIQAQTTNVRLADLVDDGGQPVGRQFAGKAPLWYYVLAEAQQQFVNDATPIRLGPVGGHIVAETIIGIMLGDRHSFISKEPDWVPPAGAGFKMADLIKKATS